MSIASTTSLLVAALDLHLVQDVIGAIRAADAAEAVAKASPFAPVPTIESPRHIHPDPIYVHPRVIHPDPRYAPRPIVHCEPHVEQTNTRLALIESSDKPAPAHSNCPIQPPWAVLPYQTPAKPPAQIKIVLYRTDILTKGTLLDVFI
ncbi:MAG TPA: hypothetical protein VFC46_10790 [Humisphaera sp.]|nr:hypothetical protein [Humisphaera sp.]